MFGKGVNKFTKLTLKGSGINHIMEGYFINHDPSNAEGYANAMHFQEITQPGNNTAGTWIPLTGRTFFKDIANMSIPGAKLTTDTYFGNAPNVEQPYSDSASNLDALSQASIVIEGHNDTLIQYNIEYTNNFDTVAYIYAFLDLNDDGIFSPSEAIIDTVAKNSTGSLSMFWRGASFPANNYVVRFRITTDILIDNIKATPNVDERAIGLARNGEVTDRIIRILPHSALPLRLMSFNGQQLGSSIKLHWETHKESDMEYFDVEKSNDGKKWNSIGKIAAQNQFVNHYEMEDTDVWEHNYYRLSMKEMSGVSYSKTLYFAGNHNQITDWQVRPTITTATIKILKTQAIPQLNIYNSQGVKIQTINTSPETQEVNVEHLQPGVYMISDGVQTQKFIKQ